MSGFFANLITEAKNGLSALGADIAADLKAIEPDAVAALDSLFSQLVPVAMKGAQQVQDAVASGALQDSEKASALKTTLESEAQAAGHSLETAGVTSAINLALEFGVTLFKIVTGKSVGQTAP